MESSLPGKSPELGMEEADLLARIRLQYPDLIALYLYGSFAAGQQTADSDVDLSVLVDGQVDPVELWNFAQQLACELDRDVDLVDLRLAPTVLQYQIITKGRCLWAADYRSGVYEAFILNSKTTLDEVRAPLIQDILARGSVYGR